MELSALDLSLETILDGEFVETHFQPLVSIKRKAVFGLEALSRGYIPDRSVVIPPQLLFQLPKDTAQRVELDRLCRRKAFAAFAPLHHAHSSLVLAINLDVSALDQTTAVSGYTARALKKHAIRPGNVIVEFNEARAPHEEHLLAFIEAIRKAGFLVALDDVGSGYSNLDRITGIRPDIIKIHRSLVERIDTEYHRQELAKSLANMAKRIGALPVAVGVEREEEALTLLELGVDIFQGYHFARPTPLQGDRLSPVDNIGRVADRFSDYMVKKIATITNQHRVYDVVIAEIVQEIARVGYPQYDELLARVLDFHPDLECIYVLTESGRQISETVCSPDRIGAARRLLYQPAEKGADHSLKEYCLPLLAGLERFTTDPYISVASGNLCKTISLFVSDADGKRRILCLDISVHE
jgi:EAL domain-containing protein (putative c-di-GMP-specific phosphodiesterase class I)